MKRRTVARFKERMPTYYSLQSIIGNKAAFPMFISTETLHWTVDDNKA